VGHAQVRRRESFSVFEGTFQNADAPDSPADMQLAGVVDYGNSSRIVAAVFQALQTFNQKRLGDLSADVSDDSAHEASLNPSSLLISTRSARR
jgi:hypothetical protein